MRIILYSLFTISTFLISAQGLREIYQEGVKAYEEKNFELFTEKMLAIDSMRPNYPAVVYNLAAGYALTDKPERSIEILSKYILMDATRDFTQDKDFTSILEHPGFAELKKKQEKLTQSIEATSSMDIPLLTAHPESITYSEKLNAFLIGGARDGRIWKLTEGKEPEVWAESAKNSWSVMGLETSYDEKILWVCTSSMNIYESYDQDEEGFASVLKYDLKSGELLETYALPGGHNFGDLISDKRGNVYISDGTANKIYWISADKGKLEILCDLSTKAFGLQGLTLNDDENFIYISDYIDGIYRLNLKNSELEKVKVNSKDVLLKGIDGLYYKDGTLIGLHNGTYPNRVIKYKLSDDNRSIVGKQVVVQDGKLGEPTQGVWQGDNFYFIMNSPWKAYDRDGNFTPEGNKLVIGILN